MVVAGRLGVGLASLAGFLLLLSLTGCDPDQMGNPPPGSAPGPQATPPRPYLGVVMRSLEFPASVASGGASAGVFLDLVVPGGAAAEGGLLEGDIVVAANATPMLTAEDFGRAIQRQSIGTGLDLAVLREGQRQELRVTPRAYTEAASAAYQDHLGLRIRSEEQQGDADTAAGSRQAAFQHYTRALQLLYHAGPAPQNENRFNSLLMRLMSVRQAGLRLPDETQRHYRRAMAVLEQARDERDNERARQSFVDALYHAPWVPELWLNAGLVSEKAGDPEAARRYLRRVLLLDPEGSEGAAVRQKLATLELLIEDRRPWQPYAATYPFDDKRQETITLRGRQLELRSVTGSVAGSDRKDKAGDLIAYGTIRPGGQRFTGKWIFRPSDESNIRCFAAEYDTDAEFAIDPTTQMLVVSVTSSNFMRDSCQVTARNPGTVTRRFPPPR